MTQYKRIAIGTSKSVLTLYCIDRRDRPPPRTNLRRAQPPPFVANPPPAGIALEACGGSHHWAREPAVFGHEAKLIPPRYVKPHVKRGRNDRNDPEAVCGEAIREAAGRPGMRDLF